MPNVWVAGSINMDIVATAARYPKIGETVPGTEISFYLEARAPIKQSPQQSSARQRS